MQPRKPIILPAKNVGSNFRLTPVTTVKELVRPSISCFLVVPVRLAMVEECSINVLINPFTREL